MSYRCKVFDRETDRMIGCYNLPIPEAAFLGSINVFMKSSRAIEQYIIVEKLPDPSPAQEEEPCTK